MNCACCGKSIDEYKGITINDRSFCNNLCRYSNEKNNKDEVVIKEKNTTTYKGSFYQKYKYTLIVLNIVCVLLYVSLTAMKLFNMKMMFGLLAVILGPWAYAWVFFPKQYLIKFLSWKTKGIFSLLPQALSVVLIRILGCVFLLIAISAIILLPFASNEQIMIK